MNLSVKMKKPKYRLSPNEVEQLVKEERERRRKLRIVQVREQAKANAAVIRNDVKREKDRLVNQLATEIEGQLTAEKEEEVRKLREKYEGTLKSIGDGHREAHLKGDGYSLVEQLQAQKDADDAAKERYKAALERHRVEEATREYEEQRHIMARQAALAVEKERASEVASRPPPPPDVLLDLQTKSKRAIQLLDMKAFATTHFHIPEYQVVRANPHEQTDAKAEAEETDLRLQEDLAEKKRSRHEQIERARIRGNQALQKEMLKHDLGDMLEDLSFMQRKDRRRRQNVLSEVPNQVFIPPERCLEQRQEEQIEMEKKFDDLYMDQFKDGFDVHSADISDYPLTQASSEALHESDESVDALVPMARINPALRDVTNVSGQRKIRQDKEPDTILKQLLNRIKAQKDGSNLTHQHPSRPEKLHDIVEEETSGKAVPDEDVDDDNTQVESKKSDQSNHEAQRLDCSSQHGSEETQANDKMVEELMTRIKLIEIQKQQLSQQYEAQTGAFRNLLKNGRPTSRTSDGMSVETGLTDLTLQEVTISSMHDNDDDKNLERAEFTEARAKLKPFQRVERSSEDNGMSSSLANVVSSLRPVSGILKGQRNLQYELLTSNGFLPSPEITTNTAGGFSEGIEREGVSLPLEECNVESEGMGRGGDAGLVIGEGKSRGFGNACREIDFGVRNDRGHRLLAVGDIRSDGGDTTAASGVNYLPNTHTMTSAFRGQDQNVNAAGRRDYEISKEAADQLNNSNSSSILSDKVIQYAAKASERHSGIDNDVVRRVEEYQSHLMSTHAERHRLLKQVRADIETRRMKLMASKQTFLADGIAGIDSVNYGQVKDSGKYSDRDDIGDGKSGQESSRRWEPIRPFVADPRLFPGADGQDKGESAGQLFKGDFLQHWSTVGLEKGEQPRQLSEERVRDSTEERRDDRSKDLTSYAEGGQKHGKLAMKKGKDKVRKSLTFDEEEKSETADVDESKISWRDILNESAMSEVSSHRVTSGEEESCSPDLGRARSHVDSQSGVSTGDKSIEDTSMGDKSSVLTGSSSLNGSALVAQAEERRLGFERRQEQLRQQLAEIQQQKDSILHRYQAGQAALLAQQSILSDKLGSVVLGDGATKSSSPADNCTRMEEFSAKPLSGSHPFVSESEPSISYQIGDGRKNRKVSGGTTWANTLGSNKRTSESSRGLSESSHEGSTSSPALGQVTDRGFVLSPFTDITLSGRPSLSSVGNTTNDSYLTDISYHKLKNGDNVSWPVSVFDHHREPNAKGLTQSQLHGPSAQHSGHTWASFLQANNSSIVSRTSKQPGVTMEPSEPSNKAFTKTKMVAGREIHLPLNSYSLSTTEMQSLQTQNLPLVSSQGQRLQSLSEHQPHELSTIVEVDTPSTSTATKRQGGIKVKDPNSVGYHVRSSATSEASVHNSSQSLSSQGSYVSAVHQPHDPFPELPHTFLKSSYIYQMPSDAAKTLGTTEERSSDALHYLNDEEHSLSETTMPYLVGDTPLKPRQQQIQGSPTLRDVDIDMTSSSLQLSGFSDYMKDKVAPEPMNEEKKMTSQLKDGDEAGCLVPADVVQAASQFGPQLVHNLREQSRDVFGDSTEGEVTLPSVSSMVSMELEEVTIDDSKSGIDE